jgi:aspartate/methionine/tyrosine aminotransferase
VFGPTRYIAWAFRLYGRAPFDLASSGIPSVKLADVGASNLDLDEPSGYVRLRAAIARYLDVSEREVIPALGTSGALFLAYASMCEPGDEVLVEHPGYEPLTRAAEGVGARVRTFERREGESFRVLPERVAASVSPRTRAIVVTNLHNPTGARVPDATLGELARIAEARGAFLLVDDVYAPFDDLPEDGVYRSSARKLGSNVITVGSLTKCYGVGMHRVGWVAGPPEIIERAEAAVIATTGHLPLSHANVGVACFAALPDLARRAKSSLDGKRLLAAEWVRTIPGLGWSAPESGLFGFATLPTTEDLLPRIERWVEEDGLLVGAGTFFGVPNGFRLSWATLPRDRFEEGLARLASRLR